MHPKLTDAIVALVQRRDRQGDCPVEPPPSTETLEGCVLELANRLARLAEREAALKADALARYKNYEDAHQTLRVRLLERIKRLESPSPQVAALREEVERLKALGSELADNENAYQEMADRERSLRAENQRLIEQVASLSAALKAAKREHDAALLCIAALSKNEARVEELLAALPTGDATR